MFSILIHLSCICQCKDTNFKANHNGFRLARSEILVVFANAKILILKLITTRLFNDNPESALYLPMQRY